MGPSNYRSIPKSNNETKDLGSTSIKISGGIINVNKYQGEQNLWISDETDDFMVDAEREIEGGREAEREREGR